MGYYNRDNQARQGSRSFGRNRSFGAKRFGGNKPYGGGGNRDRGQVQLHDAVCANCGKACQIPFVPTGDKPVYCRDCFAKMGGGEKRFDRNDAPRPAFKKFDNPRESTPSRAEFDTLNAKLDKILSLLTAKIANVPAVTLEEVSAEPVKPEAAESVTERHAVETAPAVKKKRVSKKAASAK